MKQQNNILLIGCGPHAKRIYVPLIEREKSIHKIYVIDIEEKQEDITKYLSSKNKKYETYFISKEQMTYDQLHKKVLFHLEKIVDKIDGIIIASEPLTHLMYAKWAIKKHKDILMDKPISTEFNVSSDPNKARKIREDYIELTKLYKEHRKQKEFTFSLQAQRRFHPAIKKIRELVKEITQKTSCPVTSIQSYHCDGQWRTPQEMVTQLYHSYYQGYGKCSHSGYHFFDIVPYILEAGYTEQKKPDNIGVHSSFIRPADFLEQLTLKNQSALLGEEFEAEHEMSKAEYQEEMKDYGEVDAFNIIEFKKQDKVISVASINLVHNGFSQRNWPTAHGRDLYKGNGRVRHESHIIQQGPFQCIHLHSYQSKEVEPQSKKDLFEIGGEFHIEVYCFRNSRLFGGKTVKKYEFKDINTKHLEGKSRGHQEHARALCFKEFMQAVKKEITINQMTSDLLTHKIGVCMMSAACESGASQHNDLPIKININVEEDKNI